MMLNIPDFWVAILLEGVVCVLDWYDWYTHVFWVLLCHAMCFQVRFERHACLLCRSREVQPCGAVCVCVCTA